MADPLAEPVYPGGLLADGAPRPELFGAWADAAAARLREKGLAHARFKLFQDLLAEIWSQRAGDDPAAVAEIVAILRATADQGDVPAPLRAMVHAGLDAGSSAHAVEAFLAHLAAVGERLQAGSAA